MQNLNFFTLAILFFLFAFVQNAKCLTNVSGGIYTNTTWTKANSPYVVVDTVVVFQGVTLTIQPGVTVMFANNKMMDIKGTLVALGTISDSITFTSSSSSPFPGIWNSITIANSNINYCNFRYAGKGVSVSGVVKNSTFANNDTATFYCGFVTIDSSDFFNNVYYALLDPHYTKINYCHISMNGIGIGGANQNPGEDTLMNCVIDFNNIGIEQMYLSAIYNSRINSNQIGISDGFIGDLVIKNCIIDSNSIKGIEYDYSDGSVLNCKIRNNGIGIFTYLNTNTKIQGNIIEYDSIGISGGGNNISYNDIENNYIGINGGGTISCNKICNNVVYDFVYNGLSNLNCPNNYWCTSDSASTEAVIYDGYDNINLGLVSFMPIDTSACFLVTGNQLVSDKKSFIFYPNPSSGKINLIFPSEKRREINIQVTNLLGENLFQQTVNSSLSESNIDLTILKDGIYFVMIKTGLDMITKKLVINKNAD